MVGRSGARNPVLTQQPLAVQRAAVQHQLAQPRPVTPRCIDIRTADEDAARIHFKYRVRHAQRLEDLLPKEIQARLRSAADTLVQPARQQVGGTGGIGEVLARLEQRRAGHGHVGRAVHVEQHFGGVAARRVSLIEFETR